MFRKRERRFPSTAVANKQLHAVLKRPTICSGTNGIDASKTGQTLVQ